MTRQILLVTPSFHGYGDGIATALRRRGHHVDVCAYDESTTPVARVRNRLTHQTGLNSAMYARRALTALRPTHDLVLVIKGDLLGADFYDVLDHRGVERSLWLYDELRRTRWEPSELSRVGVIASYSAHDVAALQTRGLSAFELPLAYDDSVPVVPREVSEVTFVGARYPSRESTLAQLHAAGVPVLAFGRDWSPRVVDRLRTHRLRRGPIPGAAGLTRSDAYAVMAGSPATLNLHGDQDGFTMRTFEAPGAGALQILDRADVAKYYTPGEEVLVYETPEELADLCRRAIRDRAWAQKIAAAGHRRTMSEHTLTARIAQWEARW